MGDVQGGDELLFALYPPSAGDALQGWRVITEEQVINVVEAWLDERTASAPGTEADEEMAKYLNWDGSDSEVVEASTTVVDSQECRTKPKYVRPLLLLKSSLIWLHQSQIQLPARRSRPRASANPR